MRNSGARSVFKNRAIRGLVLATMLGLVFANPSNALMTPASSNLRSKIEIGIGSSSKSGGEIAANAQSKGVGVPVESDFGRLVRVVEDHDQTLRTRWKAIWEVSRKEHPRQRAQIELWMRSKEWFVRQGALLALENLDAVSGRRWALNLLKDPSLLVRSAAIDVLAKDSGREVRKKLWGVLNDPQSYIRGKSLWVRAQVMAALCQQPQLDEIPQFLNLLGDSDQRVAGFARKAAAELDLTGVPASTSEKF